jgi:cyclopropane fatty-acyl-phospholipid synthase-like methyltransferase
LPLSIAAERNKDPILAVLRGFLPEAGRVLEIASGTGQHVLYFAAELRALEWQPSEASAAGRDALETRLAAAPLANVMTPVVLDVESAPWCVPGPIAAIVCINMIHIAPYSATTALFVGAAALLPPGGTLVLYGPFREDGRHTAPSNEAFDASLRQRNPAWGVRDLGDVTRLAAAAGLQRTRVERLPANNLVVVLEARGAVAR